MVVATWSGGPEDGSQVALRDLGPAEFFLPPKIDLKVDRDEEFIIEPTRTIIIRPELTKNGWILRWKEPKG